MDYLIHVGNVLYRASFSMRDILWHRVFTVTDEVAPANVLALEPTEYFTWSKIWHKALLRAAFEIIPDVHLITRLKDSWARLHDSHMFGQS